MISRSNVKWSQTKNTCFSTAEVTFRFSPMFFILKENTFKNSIITNICNNNIHTQNQTHEHAEVPHYVITWWNSLNQFRCEDHHLRSQIKCLTHIYNTGIYSSCVHPSKLCTIDEFNIYLNCPLYHTQKFTVLIYSTCKITCVTRMVVICWSQYTHTRFQHQGRCGESQGRSMC